MVVGPLSDTVSIVFNSAADGHRGDNALYYGPSGSITGLDGGYHYETVFVAGLGVTHAMQVYGTVLKRYTQAPPTRMADPFVASVSFWTDNGAFLFWDAEGNSLAVFGACLSPSFLRGGPPCLARQRSLITLDYQLERTHAQHFGGYFCCARRPVMGTSCTAA